MYSDHSSMQCLQRNLLIKSLFPKLKNTRLHFVHGSFYKPITLFFKQCDYYFSWDTSVNLFCEKVVLFIILLHYLFIQIILVWRNCFKASY